MRLTRRPLRPQSGHLVPGVQQVLPLHVVTRDHLDAGGDGTQGRQVVKLLPALNLKRPPPLAVVHQHGVGRSRRPTFP